MKALKIVLKHVDVINGIALWALLAIMNSHFGIFYRMMSIYAWIGWMPFILGLKRLRYLGKNGVETILFLLNVVSLLVYCFNVLGCLMMP